MNRRGFLGLLAGAGVIAAVPEFLIPTRTHFLPPRGGWRGFYGDSNVLNSAIDNLYLTSNTVWYLKESEGGLRDFNTANMQYKSYERRSIYYRDTDRATQELLDNAAMASYPQGVSLTSMAHPGSGTITAEEATFIEEGGWTCVNGHRFCNLCVGGADLSEQSLEDLCIELQKIPNPVIRPPQRIVTPEEYAAIQQAENGVSAGYEALGARVSRAFANSRLSSKLILAARMISPEMDRMVREACPDVPPLSKELTFHGETQSSPETGTPSVDVRGTGPELSDS